jgi:molybdenum cofactor cytidylyltransferase
MNTPRIGCVVLAAGFARRFGADKRQARLSDGLSVLNHTLQNAAPAFEHRLLILHEGDESLQNQYEASWPCLIAQDAALGLGHSLAAALPVMQHWDGAVIALADMPWVKTATYALIKNRLHARNLVLPYYQNQRGNPAGIGKHFFTELASPQGDQGARALFTRHASAILRLEVDDPGILRDVDTPAELRHYEITT